ncbi:MAG: phosphomannomutase/phosphoglucomutase [Patescibacteria group bacterium]
MNTVNASIFKSYDIRGIYPTDLTLETAYLIGQAYAALTGVKKIVVGRDMRIGSPEIAQRFTDGVVSQGVSVDDVGQVPIDAVYFATGKFKYDGGVMVTASHNPKEYNGMKMTVLENGISMVRGTDLYHFMEGKAFTFPSAPTPGTVASRDVMAEYLDHILSFVDVTKIKPFKIVVDAANGMAGKVMPLLFKQLPCTLIPLNFNLDGNFPAHPSNPLLPESQAQARQAVPENRADFGVILDGDTDRLFFIDDRGQVVPPDATLLVLAQHFLEKEPGAGVAYNAVISRVVPEQVATWGGRPIRTKVGFVNVAEGMRDQGGIVGGEVSAHYCFRDNFYADSGFIAFLTLLVLISEHNKPLSEIVAPFKKYTKADEVNITVNNIPEVVAAVKSKFTDGRQDELDGITIEYTDWWFNVRPSNTEPLLRITLEAATPALTQQHLEEVKGFIQSVAT